MARSRNYKAEYARRKARGLAKGLSLSQVRGHPKTGEAVRLAANRFQPKHTPPEIAAAIKLMNSGRSMTASAKEAGIVAVALRLVSLTRWGSARRPASDGSSVTGARGVFRLIVNAQTKADHSSGLR